MPAKPVAAFVPLLFGVGFAVGFTVAFDVGFDDEVPLGVGYITGDAEALFVAVNDGPLTPPLRPGIDGS
jgi:hypothetical protein